MIRILKKNTLAKEENNPQPPTATSDAGIKRWSMAQRKTVRCGIQHGVLIYLCCESVPYLVNSSILVKVSYQASPKTTIN